MSNQKYLQGDLLLVNRVADSFASTFGEVKSNILDSHIIQSPVPPNIGTYPDLADGTVWVDTSQTPPALNIWDGSTWNEIEGGSGSNIAEPEPDDLSFSPSVGGGGTQGSPYVLDTVTSYSVGGTVQSENSITISNQEPFAVVIIETLEGGLRFQQDVGFCDENGQWSGTFVYVDQPNSVTGETYDAKFKIGTETGVFIDWSVIQVVNKTPIVGGDSTTSAPNATPPEVDNDADKLYGTGTATWADGSGTLSSVPSLTRTGSSDAILFGVNGGTINKSDKSISDGDTLVVIFDETLADGADDGDKISGALTNNAGFYQEWSMTKNTKADAWTIDPLVDQALSATVTSTNVVISGINAQSQVDLINGSSTLTNVAVSVNGESFDSSFPVAFNPGDTLQFQGDVGQLPDTEYKAVFSVGGTEATWSVTTVDAVPTITQPTITSPTNGAVNLLPEVTLVSSDYYGEGGVGAHNDSSWEVYESDLGAIPKTSEAQSINLLPEGPEVDYTPTSSSINGLTTGTISGAYKNPSSKIEESSWKSIAYGNGFHVAVANSGTKRLMYATDPTGAWTAKEAAADSTWTGITYGDGKFVAVAYDTSNNIMYTDDPTGTWTVLSASQGGWNAIAYGNGHFVAVAQNTTSQQVMYATDPAGPWTSVTVPGGNDVTYNGVHYADGYWVAVGSRSTAAAQKIIYATDPAGPWQYADMTGDNARFEGVAYGNGVWVAVASMGSYNTIFWSSSARGPFNRTSQSQVNATNAITFANGLFVTCGSAGGKRLGWSTDGQNWTGCTDEVIKDGSWYSICYGNGYFVSPGYGGDKTRLAYSPTGGPDADTAELTLSDTKVYDSEGDEIPNATINSVFKKGEEVYSSEDSSIVGLLVSDGDDDSNSLSLTNVKGNWQSGHKVVNKVTKTTPSLISELILQDNKIYNAEDGTEFVGKTIADAFKAGDKVVAEDDTVVFSDSPAFSTTLYTGSASLITENNGIDNTGKNLLWIKDRSAILRHYLFSNAYPDNWLSSDETNGVRSSDGVDFLNNGYTLAPNERGFSNPTDNYVSWNFRGAPGFLDVVTYTGKDEPQTVSHSLGSAPGMMIVKNTTGNYSWNVYHKSLGADAVLELETSYGASIGGVMAWNQTEPTSSEFTVGEMVTTNSDANDYVAYLFADTPGLIKCDSYGPNFSFPEKITTGFKPGWLLIKKVNDARDWIIFDPKRTDGGGLDALYPNNSNPDTDSFSTIEFNDDGFTITGDNSNYGRPGATFIYVAIAENAQAGQFMPTGVLTEDAAGTSMKLTDVVGTWEAGMAAVNQNPTRVEPTPPPSTDPPSAAYTKVLDAANDTVNKTSYDLTNSALEGGKSYHSRVKYSDGTYESEFSPYNTFGVGEPEVPDVWLPASAAENNYWRDIAYGGGKYVAVSSSGSTRVMYSTDGINWSNAGVTGVNAEEWWGVTYGAGKFVAVSESGGGKAMYSTDGISWTSVSTPSGKWESVVYGGDKFVAVGSTGAGASVAYSLDGVTWTDNSITGTASGNWVDVTYGNGIFVVVSSDKDNANRVMVSGDGIAWTPVPAVAANWQNVAFGGGTFVAVSPTDDVMYSDDGTNWTAGQPSTEAIYYGLAYGAGKFVAVSYDKDVMYSFDGGKNWEDASKAGGTQDWQAVCYGPGKFVAVGIGGTDRVMYSFA